MVEVRELAEQMAGHQEQAEAARAQVVLGRMRAVLEQHNKRVPQGAPAKGLHPMGVSLPLDFDEWLHAEVRRQNDEGGFHFSGRVTRSELLKAALEIRLPDLALYADFADLVAKRRRAVGSREVHLKVPVATARAMAEIGAAIPDRRIALSPKAVSEALIYAWATTLAEPAFELAELPPTRGRHLKA